MNDEPCPTCHIPLGASLKALREERDRLIPFVTQHRPKREEFLKWEKELKDLAARIAESEEDLRRRTEKLTSDEAALAELTDETLRPEKEFEQLRQEKQELRKEVEKLAEDSLKAAAESQASLESLRQKLSAEKVKRKNVDEESAAARIQLSDLTESYGELSRELDSLGARYARESKLLESARDENASLKQKKKGLLREKRDLLQEKEELLDQKSKSEKSAASLKKTNEKLKTKIRDLEEQISDFRSVSFAISDLALLDALSREVSDLFLPPTKIVSVGSGPFLENDFDHYLETLRITPCADGCPWIIVGRDGWTEEKLNELLDDADLDEVRVFSQELFIAGILTTHDPFSLPTEILMKFAEGHPALEYLIEAGFEWPEIILEEDYGEPSTGSFGGVEESPLSLMGYHVGVTRGLTKQERRCLLRAAFLGEIDYVGDDEYMEAWGRPNHSKRLWRIAHHLKREAEKRKTIPSMCHAVRDWQEDSKWLKEKFYTRRMRFNWPDF